MLLFSALSRLHCCFSLKEICYKDIAVLREVLKSLLRALTHTQNAHVEL